MHILTSRQLQEADARTLDVQKISSWQLMERAARALFENLKTDVDIHTTHFVILCGSGNNGGDGLALARMIYASGGDVKVFLLKSSSYSADNLENQRSLGEIPFTFFDPSSRVNFPGECLIIDALFGYGLNRPLDQDWAGLVEQINRSGNYVISVDMPSGLLADAPTPLHAPVIKAQKVYTFHSPKKALLLPENALWAEDFRVIPIGLEAGPAGKEFYVTADDVKRRIKRPSRFAHKGSFGHALIAGGSYGKAGAVILASHAALKTGCGLVSAYAPRCAYIPLQTALPEAMVLTDPGEEYLSIFPAELHRFSSLGVGTGMGTSPETERAFLRLLEAGNLPPLVLDADALNILSHNPEYLSKLPAKSVLTPHPKELERLIGPWADDFEKLEAGLNLARERSIILVIKGANTAILFPDGTLAFNSTGNYGMAKGGSGDVLTGVITSLLAQGYLPEDAAITGVYLHGLAGDVARDRLGPRGMLASDIIQALPAAWQQVSAGTPYAFR